MTKELTYDEESAKNEEQFKQIVKSVRPDIWLLMDIVDQTGINPFVLWRVAYALNNIATTTKYGNVVVEIENGTVRFVRGQSADKVNEPLIKTLDSKDNSV
jgi:hypothetical protein